MQKFITRVIAVCLALIAPALAVKVPEGIFQGWDGEWTHVSKQLIALAEAMPEEKFAWRPGAGVRSTSEVYMHIAYTNFYLLTFTGQKMPAELQQDAQTVEKTIISKAEVIKWLKQSLEAVKRAHLAETRQDLHRKVKALGGMTSTVDAVYLRIIIHNNEHMGQAVAYARINGVVPPWSR